MLSPAIRMARDYNRSLPRPVRWLHVIIAALLAFWRATFAASWWGLHIVFPLLLGAVGFVLVHPFDAHLSHLAERLSHALSGDLRRELTAWQQYGQGLAIALAALAIWLLEPLRRRRLLDLALAIALAKLIAQAAKMLVGRPRPRPEFEDPTTFLGPWGEYPIILKDSTIKLVHAWDIRAGAGTDLWSMPSSHTLFAAVLSVFLSAMYPRLRPLLLALVVLVGACRVIFDAHWATDVIVGAAAGYAIAAAVVHQFLGVRLIDTLWRRLINPHASPALPAIRETELAATRR